MLHTKSLILMWPNVVRGSDSQARLTSLHVDQTLFQHWQTWKSPQMFWPESFTVCSACAHVQWVLHLNRTVRKYCTVTPPLSSSPSSILCLSCSCFDLYLLRLLSLKSWMKICLFKGLQFVIWLQPHNINLCCEILEEEAENVVEHSKGYNFSQNWSKTFFFPF